MMRKRLFLLLSVLLIAAMACALPGGQSGTAEPKSVETSVAATLTAIGAEGQQPTEPPDTEQPGEETPAAPAGETTEPPVDADLVVVYTHQGNPWVVIDDGAPQQLSDAGDTVDVLISDDARRIVFLRRDQEADPAQPVEIRSVNLDGTGEQVLMSPEEFDALYPLEDFVRYDVSSIKFIPGSHQLLMTTRGVAEGPGLARNNDLLRLDADTGELTTVLPRGEAGSFFPSPDGTRMVLVQSDSMSMADIDGTNKSEVLTFEPIITYSEFLYHPPVIWLPDGQAAGTVIPNADILAEELTGTAWRLPQDGSPAEELIQVEGSVYFAQESGGVVLSPAFDRIISITGEQGARELMITTIPDGAATEYDTGVGNWRGWAPDGQHFLYSVGDPDQVHLGTLGGSPEPLVAGMDFSWLSASEFLFLSGSQTNWTLRRGSIDGSTQDLANSDSRFTQYDFAQP